MPDAMTEPETSPHKSKGGMRRVFNALRYSLQGLRAAFKYEAAFRQELALAALMTPAAFFLGRTAGEVLLLLLTVVLVLAVELLNSAIEALADAISVDTHPLLGRAKDLGSAAVMLMLIFAGATWAVLLVHRFVP
jgi:diacylglycerol kinase (ATP)